MRVEVVEEAEGGVEAEVEEVVVVAPPYRLRVSRVTPAHTPAQGHNKHGHMHMRMAIWP